MKLPDVPLPEKLSMRIGVLVLAVAVIAALAVTGVRQFTGLPDNAALEYDGVVVTQADLADRVDLLGALYGIQEPKKKKAKEAFRRDVAKAVAVTMILDKAAREHHIVISDKSARDTLAEMVKGQLGENPEAAFTKLLGQYGVNENDILEELARQQAIARLFQDVTKDQVKTATPDAVRAYFDRNPGKFAIPEQRRLSNIVVASRKDATAVLAQAKKGKDFGALARKTTLDDATRDKDGELGTVTEAKLDPAFAKAAFGASEGGLFGPVKSLYGWNVGVVDKVIPGKATKFATVKDQVTDVLRSERGLAAWRHWIAGEIKDADVEYADRYLPKHPNEPPTDSVGPNPAAGSSGGAGTPAGQ